MSMLTRRTNVLLEEEDYLHLSLLAHETGRTMGELVRRAVKKTYKAKKPLTQTQEAFREIRRLTKGMNFSGLDYKALINEGRKY